MSTTLAIVNRVRILFVNRGTRETYTDSDIISTAINPTAREIASVALVSMKSTTVTTVAGQSDYDLPSAVMPFIRMSSITYDADHRKLNWRDNNEVDITPTSGGVPYYWTTWANKLRIKPTPVVNGVTIYIDVYGGPVPCAETTPAASVDELSFTADAEDALVYGAAKIMCEIDRETERSVAFSNEYQAKLALLRSKLAPDGQRPAYIQDRFEDDVYFFTA